MDEKSSETDWNFADICEAIARRVPERPAQMQGGRVITWRELDSRVNALAADFLQAGLTHQSKVVCYLHNCPEYLLPDGEVRYRPARRRFHRGVTESEVMALADGPTEVHRSRSPASTRNRIHEIDTTDLVTVESALDRSGKLATC
jgi:AMP-binding enzyme